MSRGKSYVHSRSGDIIKIEIRDSTYRVLYNIKFNIQDKKTWVNVIDVIEKFGFSVADAIKLKHELGKWF